MLDSNFYPIFETKLICNVLTHEIENFQKLNIFMKLKNYKSLKKLHFEFIVQIFF